MIRLNPTALSVTMDEVKSYETRRRQSSSLDVGEPQSSRKERILGSNEERPPQAASHTSPSLASSAPPWAAIQGTAKDEDMHVSPLQTPTNTTETKDSPMEDAHVAAIATAPPISESSPGDTLVDNDEVAIAVDGYGGGSHTTVGVNINVSANVNVTPRPTSRALGQGTFRHRESSHPGYDGTGSPRWMSLPPRRPHPAWTAAEREIARSPLSNRVPR